MAKDTKVSLVIGLVDDASKELKELVNNHKVAFTAIAAGAVAATAALTALGVASVKQAAKLEKGIAEVGTLLGRSVSEMEEFSEGVKQVMSESGEQVEILTKGLFDLVSAGVEAAEATTVLSQAALLADAGVTDVSIAVDGLTSILNAYNLEANQAADVSDLLFTAQKFGKTTVAELSSSIGRLAPIMSAANVSTEEMFAALSTITLAGISTDEAVTSLVATMNSLLDPQDQAIDEAKTMGIELGAAAFKANGFTKTLQNLVTATDGDIEAIQKLGITVRGLKGILTLTTNDGKKYNEILEGMKDRSGSTQKAAEQMRQTFSKQSDILSGKLNVSLADIGDELLPTLTEALNEANQFLDENRESIRSLGVVMGDAIKVIFNLTSAIGNASIRLGEFFNVLDNRTVFQQAKDNVDDLQAKYNNLVEISRIGTGGFKTNSKALIELGTQLIAAKEKVNELTIAQQEQIKLQALPPALKPPEVPTREEEIDPIGLQKLEAAEIAAIEREKNKELLALETEINDQRQQLFIQTQERRIATIEDDTERELELITFRMTQELSALNDLELSKQEIKGASDAIIAEADFNRRQIIEERDAEDFEKLQKLEENRIAKIIKTNDAIIANTNDLSAAMSAAWENFALKAQSSMGRVANLTVSATKQITAGFGGAIAGMIVDGENFAESMERVMRQVAKNIISQLIQIAIESVIVNAIQSTSTLGTHAANTFAGAFAATVAIPVVGPALAPGVAAGSLATMLAGVPGAKASGAALGAVPALADGGLITRPTLVLAGEAGPEKIIPLDRAEEELGQSQTPIVINLNGPILGDDFQAREFAIKIDEQLFDLKQQRQSLAFA